MSDTNPKAPMKPVQQHILMAFRILDIPDKPLAAIAFQTKAGGRHRFVANQQMLMGLAKALVEHAKKMPPGEGKANDSTTAVKKDPQDWFDA
jgi:hypothetical protein